MSLRIQTTIGALTPADLGAVLMHEHLVFGLEGYETWDRAAVTALATERLAEARETGVGTLVEMTTCGVMRDIDLMLAVSRQARVPIVVATGCWLANAIPQRLAELNTRGLAKVFVDELTVGIDQSGIRAGIIKAATGINAVHPLEERVLHAAAWAQRETGACISTHTSGSSLGVEQIDLLREAGADLTRVVIGHCDNREDLDYLHALLAHGVTVQFDHIGANAPWTLPDERKVELLTTLIDEGFVTQLTLSQDTIAHIAGRPDAEQPLHRRPSYLLNEFVRHLPGDAVHQILVVNPARLLPFHEP
jgi:predicted metal-dependent phosphotriesterase family hydrolase